MGQARVRRAARVTTVPRHSTSTIPPAFSAVLAGIPDPTQPMSTLRHPHPSMWLPFLYLVLAMIGTITWLRAAAAQTNAQTGAAAQAPAPRNVLLIVADDLNTDLGCYGEARVRTPNIDRLAARGVRFDRAFCQYPLCNPSRASFLSGRRPETLGIYVLQTAARTAAPEAVFLPELFRRNGHRTEGAGKVFHSPATNDAASWDSYEDRESDDPEELASIKRRYQGGRGEPTWDPLSGDGSLTRDGRNSRLIAARIAALAREGRPFFLAAGFHKPHLPWNAPKRFFDLYDPARLAQAPEPAMRGIPQLALQTELAGFGQPETRAGAVAAYYACVSFMDDNVGRLLDALREAGLEDNTLVVFVGDNGFHLGDHGGLWSKHTAFDRATRVPLILAGPGIARGRTIRTPVELLDLYPTLAALGGLKAPPGLEGRDLSAALAPGADPDAALQARPVGSIVFHFDVARRRDVPGRTVLFDGWRYTEWGAAAADGRELYDLNNDAGEYTNRADDPAAAAQAGLGARLLREAPAYKPGPANRPRALNPEPKKKKT